MAEKESKTFFKKTAAKITVALAIIGAIATLFANLTTIQNFFQKNFGDKKGVKIVDVTVNDSTKNNDDTSTEASNEMLNFSAIDFTNKEVDIKMRNNGEEVAFIKKVELVIKRKWLLTVDRGATFITIPSSRTYDITMDSERAAPYTIPVNVSHQIDPGGTDRFKLSLKHGPDTYNTYVYLVDVRIYFNENDQSIARENIFVSFEKNSSNTYKKNRGNFQNANEIDSINGRKEESINKLVDKIMNQ